ncbi:MAG: hypothetical protein BRC28_02750 [Nanohaloarchaea archaeon SW_4_43_9]|nr:MAG: hypothetical protein BRC28_02750 [Nanohaloarchaea archaeon SW_4_43_9]
MELKEEISKKTHEAIDEFRAEYREAVNEYPKLGAMIPFIGKMFVAGLIFRGILFLSPNTYFLQQHLAEIISYIMNLLGGSYQLQNALIIGPESNYLITRDCLGWKSIAAFIGLIFASTSNLRKHLNIVLIGSTVLIILNIFRVITTIWLSELGVVSFDIIHTFLWRWGMTVVVFLLWFFLLRRYSSDLL